MGFWVFGLGVTVWCFFCFRFVGLGWWFGGGVGGRIVFDFIGFCRLGGFVILGLMGGFGC